MDVLDECRGPNKGVQANFLEVFDRKKRKLSTKGVKILDDTKVDDNFTKNGKNFMTRSIQVEIELEADEKIQEISKYSKSGNGSRVHSPDIDDLCRKKFKPIAPKPILGKDQHQPVVVATVPVKFVSSCNTTPSENSKLNTMSSDCRTMVLNSGFSVLGNAPIILQSGSKHMDGGITKVFTLNAQNMTSDGIVQVVVPPPNSSITAMPSPNMGMNHSTLLSQTSLSNITEQQSQDINWASAKAMMNGVQAQNYAAMQQTQSHVPAGLNMSNTVGNNNIPVNANLPQNVKDILRLRPSKYKYSLLLNSPMYSNIKTAMGITPMPNAAVIAENTSQGYQVASNVSHNNMPVVPASYGNTAAPLMSPVLISAVQPTNVSAVQLSMLPQGQTVMTPVMNPSQLSPALHSPGIPIQTSIPPISANTVGTEARNVNNSNSGILYQNNSQSQSYARTMPNTSALYSVPKPTGQYVQSYASTNQPLRTSSQQKHPSFFIDTDMVIRNTANMSQPTLIPPVHSVNTSRMLHIPPVTSTVISETCTSFRTDSQSVSVSETSINSTATGSTSPAVTTWTPKPSTPVSTHVVTMYKPPSLSTMISNLAAQMPYQRLPLSRSHPAQAQQIQQPFQSQLQQQPQPVSISGLSRLPLSLQEPTQTATTMFIPHLQNHSRENRIPSKTLNTSKLSMSENSTINKTHCEGLLSVPTTSTRQVHMYQPNASNSVVSNSNNRFSSSPVTSNLNVGQKVNASPVQQSPTSSLSTVSSASSIAPTNGAYFAHQITSTSLMPRPSIHPSSTFSQQVASTDAIPGPPMQLTSPLPVTSIVHVASTLPVISSTFHNINANKNSFVQSAYPPTLQYSNGYTGTSPAPASAAIPVAISRQPNSATFQNLTNTISRNVPNSLNSNAVSNDTPRPENANRSQHLHLPSRTTPHVIQNVPRCLQSTLIPMSDGVSQARQNSRKSPSSTASITLPIRTSIIPQRSVSSLHMEHPAPPPPPISRSNIAAPVCQISAVSSTSRSDTTSLSWPAHAAAISTQHHVPLVTVTTAPVNSRLSNINNTSFTFSNHPRSSMCSSNVQLNNNIPTTSSIGTSISTMFSPPSMTMAHSGCATQQRLQRKSTSGGTPSPSQLPMNVVSEGQRFTQNIARNVLSVPPFVNQSGIAFSQQRGNLTQNSSTNNSVRSPTMPNAIGTSVQPGLSPYIENNVCVSNQFIGNQSSKNSNQLSHGTSTLQLQNVTSDTCVNRDMDQITRPVVSVVSPTSSHTSPTTSNNLQQKTMPTGHSEQNPSSNVMRLGLDQSTGVDVPMQMTNQTTILNTLTLRQKQGRGTRSIQNRQVLPSQITGKQLANSSDSSLPTRQPEISQTVNTPIPNKQTSSKHDKHDQRSGSKNRVRSSNKNAKTSQQEGGNIQKPHNPVHQKSNREDQTMSPSRSDNGNKPEPAQAAKLTVHHKPPNQQIPSSLATDLISRVNLPFMQPIFCNTSTPTIPNPLEGLHHVPMHSLLPDHSIPGHVHALPPPHPAPPPPPPPPPVAVGPPAPAPTPSSHQGPPSHLYVGAHFRPMHHHMFMPPSPRQAEFNLLSPRTFTPVHFQQDVPLYNPPLSSPPSVTDSVLSMHSNHSLMDNRVTSSLLYESTGFHHPAPPPQPAVNAISEFHSSHRDLSARFGQHHTLRSGPPASASFSDAAIVKPVNNETSREHSTVHRESFRTPPSERPNSRQLPNTRFTIISAASNTPNVTSPFTSVSSTSNLPVSSNNNTVATSPTGSASRFAQTHHDKYLPLELSMTTPPTPTTETPNQTASSNTQINNKVTQPDEPVKFSDTILQCSRQILRESGRTVLCCWNCEYHTAEPKKMHRHQRSEDKAMKCQLCSFQGISRCEVNQHFKMAHMQPENDPLRESF